jgi:hypothetical protein
MAEGRFPEGAAGEEDKKMFDNHYKLVVAEMTQWQYRAMLHTKWRDLKNDMKGFWRAPDKTLHTKLVGDMAKLLPIVFEASKGQKYSPFARYTALLTYGELNSDEGADAGGAGVVPYAEALPRLIAVLKNKDNKYPAYLQWAAFAGMTRHIVCTKNSITPENRKELVQILAAWLKNPPADGITPEVQSFTRRRASDLLRLLAGRWPEANNVDVVTALNQFAADEDAPLDDRCEAIRTLGSLDKKSFPEKNIPAVARTIALLTAEVGRLTPAPQPIAAPAVEEGAEEPAADGAAPPADAPAVAEKAPPAAVAAADPAVPAEEASVGKSQNVLPPDLQAYFLTCLRSGVLGPPDVQSRGLGSAATADNKQLLMDVVGKIDEMIAVVKRKKREDKLSEDEIRKLQDLATGVETIIGHKPADADGATEQARATKR